MVRSLIRVSPVEPPVVSPNTSALAPLPDDEAAKLGDAVEILRQVKRVFSFLEFSSRRSINPKDLVESCKSLNLSNPVYQQNDARDLCDKLVDRLETALRAQGVDRPLKNVFGGKVVHQSIKKGCPHPPTERADDFIALELQIKGKPDVESSLRDFCTSEMLDGDNKVMCDECKKKFPAELRDCLSEDLPRVLVLHLKRFELDYDTFETVKVNDKCAFPLELDVAPYTNNPSSPKVFSLCGVLVHRGVAGGGHYYSFAKDRTTQKWYRFNDDRVTIFTPDKIPEECFGGPAKAVAGPSGALDSDTNAYMLFYERKDTEELQPEKVQLKARALGNEDISSVHLLERLKEAAIQTNEQLRNEVTHDNDVQRLQLVLCSAELANAVVDLMEPSTWTLPDEATLPSARALLPSLEAGRRELIAASVEVAFDWLFRTTNFDMVEKLSHSLVDVVSKSDWAASHVLERCSERLREFLLRCKANAVQRSFLRIALACAERAGFAKGGNAPLMVSLCRFSTTAVRLLNEASRNFRLACELAGLLRDLCRFQVFKDVMRTGPVHGLTLLVHFLLQKESPFVAYGKKPSRDETIGNAKPLAGGEAVGERPISPRDKTSNVRPAPDGTLAEDPIVLDDSDRSGSPGDDIDGKNGGAADLVSTGSSSSSGNVINGSLNNGLFGPGLVHADVAFDWVSPGPGGIYFFLPLYEGTWESLLHRWTSTGGTSACLISPLDAFHHALGELLFPISALPTHVATMGSTAYSVIYDRIIRLSPRPNRFAGWLKEVCAADVLASSTLATVKADLRPSTASTIVPTLEAKQVGGVVVGVESSQNPVFLPLPPVKNEDEGLPIKFRQSNTARILLDLLFVLTRLPASFASTQDQDSADPLRYESFAGALAAVLCLQDAWQKDRITYAISRGGMLGKALHESTEGLAFVKGLYPSLQVEFDKRANLPYIERFSALFSCAAPLMKRVWHLHHQDNPPVCMRLHYHEAQIGRVAKLLARLVVDIPGVAEVIRDVSEGIRKKLPELEDDLTRLIMWYAARSLDQQGDGIIDPVHRNIRHRSAESNNVLRALVPLCGLPMSSFLERDPDPNRLRPDELGRLVIGPMLLYDEKAVYSRATAYLVDYPLPSDGILVEFQARLSNNFAKSKDANFEEWFCVVVAARPAEFIVRRRDYEYVPLAANQQAFKVFDRVRVNGLDVVRARNRLHVILDEGEDLEEEEEEAKLKSKETRTNRNVVDDGMEEEGGEEEMERRQGVGVGVGTEEREAEEGDEEEETNAEGTEVALDDDEEEGGGEEQDGDQLEDDVGEEDQADQEQDGEEESGPEDGGEDEEEEDEEEEQEDEGGDNTNVQEENEEEEDAAPVPVPGGNRRRHTEESHEEDDRRKRQDFGRGVQGPEPRHIIPAPPRVSQGLEAKGPTPMNRLRPSNLPTGRHAPADVEEEEEEEEDTGEEDRSDDVVPLRPPANQQTRHPQVAQRSHLGVERKPQTTSVKSDGKVSPPALVAQVGGRKDLLPTTTSAPTPDEQQQPRQIPAQDQVQGLPPANVQQEVRGKVGSSPRTAPRATAAGGSTSTTTAFQPVRDMLGVVVRVIPSQPPRYIVRLDSQSDSKHKSCIKAYEELAVDAVPNDDPDVLELPADALTFTSDQLSVNDNPFIVRHVQSLGKMEETSDVSQSRVLALQVRRGERLVLVSRGVLGLCWSNWQDMDPATFAYYYYGPQVPATIPKVGGLMNGMTFETGARPGFNFKVVPDSNQGG